ncbi:hypothetical protein CY35_02G056400 [Sphagnum magellanicum]|nr:hypothetical protein CY35_02G056400 [Sphagnum magellanicum]KAH9570728.1 hypothetical protein CY35_02G056400 [Sphagnum magellanicum]
MDGGEIWAAHMSNSKPHHNLHHQPSSHSAHLDQHINLDDVDGDEDVRSDFSCPYCYEDFDLTSLCSHLEDEHCFEFKPAICPVCAARIGKDMLGHVTLQHANLLKMQRRRRFQRGGTPSSATLSLLGKELRDAHLQALLGGSTSYMGSLSTNAADPLLSNLGYSLPISEAEDPPKPSVTVDIPSKPLTSIHQQNPSVDASLTAEEREQKSKDAALRAKFMQQLVLSTIFGDS